ncbi:MAG: TPM domain-containing protein, partial [Chitinophagales bacterium]
MVNSIIKDLEDSTTVQVGVVVINSIGNAVPKEFATALFRHWGIGQAEKDNGLLILLVINQRRMEFEVGYGLEGILTDGICKRIQMEYMVPYAKQEDYNACVLNGVMEVSRILSDPKYREEVYAGTDAYGNYLKPLSRQNIALPVVITLGIIYFISLIAVWRTNEKALKKAPVYVQHHYNAGYVNTKNALIGIALPVAYLGTQISTGNLRVFEFWTFVYAFIAFLLIEKRMRLNTYIIKETDAQKDEAYKAYNFLARSHSKGWFTSVIFFPVPFLLYWFWHRWQMKILRNTPPHSEDGTT